MDITICERCLGGKLISIVKIGNDLKIICGNCKSCSVGEINANAWNIIKSKKDILKNKKLINFCLKDVNVPKDCVFFVEQTLKDEFNISKL